MDKQEAIEKLKVYIEEWDKIEGVHPQNEDDFKIPFIELLKSLNSDCFEFMGENHYCGHTAIVVEDGIQFSWPSDGLFFEFAYDNDFVKVFTGKHSGFWVPEYLSLSGDEAQPILNILKQKFLEWGGFSDGLA